MPSSRLWGPGLGLLVACATAPPAPEAVRFHDAGLTHLAEGRCDRAEESFGLALEYGGGFAHPHNGLGMVDLVCTGDAEQARRHFEAALALDPDFAEALNNLGAAHHRSAPPRVEAACAAFAAALRVDPGYADARENLGACLMRRGVIAGASGDPQARGRWFDQARSHLRRLLEIDGARPMAHHHLGLIALVEARLPAAERHLERCLRLSPREPVCSYNLGQVLLRTARCRPAMERFVDALAAEEQDVLIGARHGLGLAYARCAEPDGPLRAVWERVRTEPANPVHHHRLGRLYADRGQPEQAEDEWLRATRLDPSFCPAHLDLAHQASAQGRAALARSRCRAYVRCVSEAGDSLGAEAARSRCPTGRGREGPGR